MRATVSSGRLCPLCPSTILPVWAERADLRPRRGAETDMDLMRAAGRWRGAVSVARVACLAGWLAAVRGVRGPATCRYCPKRARNHGIDTINDKKYTHNSCENWQEPTRIGCRRAAGSTAWSGGSRATGATVTSGLWSSPWRRAGASARTTTQSPSTASGSPAACRPEVLFGRGWNMKGSTWQGLWIGV